MLLDGALQNFLIITFYLCFLIFLRGQKLFYEEYDTTFTFIKTTLDIGQYITFITIISVAEIVTFIAYKYYSRGEAMFANKKGSRWISYDWNYLRPMVRLLFYVTLPCALYMQLKIVMVKSALIYTDAYLINVDVPLFVKLGNFIWQTVSLVYLAMRPSKKEAIFVCLSLLFVQGFIQLFQGRRALFASTLFFVIWYYIKYNNIRKIHGKSIIYYVIGGMALLMLFFYVGVHRSGGTIDVDSLFVIIKYFMISTGGSDSVLANTIVNVDSFPHPGVLYLFDPIIFNPVVNIFYDKSGLPQGMEYLNSHFTFSHWISYLTEPSLYLSGRGMGSCYLAELYVAFGVLGVVVVSIILGYLFTVFTRIDIEHGSVFINCLCFLLIKSTFTLPRDGLFSWFPSFVYMMIIFMFLFIFLPAKQKLNYTF